MSAVRSPLRRMIALGAVLSLPALGLLPMQTAAAVTGCSSAGYGVYRSAPAVTAKTVALTFDDGPGRDTGRIMSILAANHVTATFFNLGVNEASLPSTVRSELSYGFALGDHTWDHQSLPGLSWSGQASEMDRERAEQARITGAYPCLFRPPYGNYNSSTLQLARNRGMWVWNWSVDTEDWKAAGSGDSYWVDRIRTRAIAGGSQAHPVILMHNQPRGNPATVAALPAIISYYRSHGYMFVDLYAHGRPPSVRAISAHSGPIAGGTRVTVTGRDFRGVRKVTFGSAVGTSLHVTSSTSLSVTAPAHAAGVVPVRVTTTIGLSALTSADNFSYVAPPTVTAVTPTSGTTAGGTQVRVSGTNFVAVTAVRFGSGAGTALHVSSSTTLYVTAPAHAAGALDVRVTTAYGLSAVHAADQFRYVAPPVVTGVSPAAGPTGGATVVTVTGSGFTGATAVRFGAVAGTALTVDSPTQLRVTSPAGTGGAVDVRVTTAHGTSPVAVADRFTYVAPPAVTGLSPAEGPVDGGTVVTVTGAGFTGATSVVFGTVADTALTVNSPTQLTVTSPAGAEGAVDVQVTTPYGTSPVTAADQYTYLPPPPLGGTTVRRAGDGG